MRAKSRIDPDWEEADPNYRIKREHGAILIERQAKLLEAGFRLDIPRMTRSGDIRLQHPNKKMPELTIWDDGLVNDAYPSHFKGRDDERTIFEPEDAEGFNRFIAHVPKPNLIEKIRISTVGEAFYVILAWTIVIAFGVAASNIGEKIRDWFTQS